MVAIDTETVAVSLKLWIGSFSLGAKAHAKKIKK